jgi:hypothetical protein
MKARGGGCGMRQATICWAGWYTWKRSSSQPPASVADFQTPSSVMVNKFKPRESGDLVRRLQTSKVAQMPYLPGRQGSFYSPHDPSTKGNENFFMTPIRQFAPVLSFRFGDLFSRPSLGPWRTRLCPCSPCSCPLDTNSGLHLIKER